MSYWVKHSEDLRIPDWLKDKLPSTCPICGNPMVNYYNDDCRCTNRRCLNDDCPGMLASRADFMRRLVNIQGIGYANCLDIIRNNNLDTHIATLYYMGVKPKVDLTTFLRMMCLPGIDGEIEKIVKTIGAYSIEDIINNYNGKWLSLFKDNYEFIKFGERYVQLEERPEIECKPVITYTIMITGTPIGYSSKDDFIDDMNRIGKGACLILHQKSPRQSRVDYLIREPNSTTRGKVTAAIKGGIPIVTSAEFKSIIYSIAALRNLKN